MDDDIAAGPAPDGAVMVVNTDPDACELVARLVERAGFPAVRFFDPGSVVDQLTEGGVAGVVIDAAGTGVAEALRALEAVRAAEPSVRDTVVVVLAETDADRLHAYQTGADGYLARPFHADDLTETVRATMARSLEDRVSYRNVQLMGGAATS